jgi:hypothetical protein
LRKGLFTDEFNLFWSKSSDPNDSPLLIQALKIKQSVIYPRPTLPAIIASFEAVQTDASAGTGESVHSVNALV